MFRKILVPTDGSTEMACVAEFAVQFAKFTHGSLISVGVARPHSFTSGNAIATGEIADYAKEVMKETGRIAAQISQTAERHAVPCEAFVVYSFDIAEEITRVAIEKQCDAIFMATHVKSKLENIFTGSVTQDVIRLSRILVLVFPGS